jgi:Spy/CpxP family protein refolding chaperone
MSLKSALVAGIAVIGLGLPAIAFAADASASKVPAMEKNAVDNAARIDNHIKELHDKLKITSEQESKWKDVADAMRKTAKEVRDKLSDRDEKDKTSTVTAVDQLKAYAAIQEAQYDGAKRLIDPFEDLYKVMSPEQKKDADELFAQPRETSKAVGASGGHRKAN